MCQGKHSARQPVVFRVKGNRYRLIVQIDYRKGIVVAIFFGTHAEYDEFNAREA